MMSQNFSWLNDCSFAKLEQIRKEIVRLQMAKANAFAEEVEHDVDDNAAIIKDIDDKIQYIDNMRLSGNYKNKIGQWRSWQSSIKELQNYKGKVNSATQLHTFRFFVNECGLADSLDDKGSPNVKEILEGWRRDFNNIVNGLQRNYPDQYSEYFKEQDLKGMLAEWKKRNESLILKIYGMMYDNDFELYNLIRKNWRKTNKGFINAIIVSNYSPESKKILKGDHWKNLSNQEIVDKVDRRIKAMYDLCCDLRQQQQPFHSVVNQQGINHSYSQIASGNHQNINNGCSQMARSYGPCSRHY